MIGEKNILLLSPSPTHSLGICQSRAPLGGNLLFQCYPIFQMDKHTSPFTNLLWRWWMRVAQGLHRREGFSHPEDVPVPKRVLERNAIVTGAWTSVTGQPWCDRIPILYPLYNPPESSFVCNHTSIKANVDDRMSKYSLFTARSVKFTVWY